MKIHLLIVFLFFTILFSKSQDLIIKIDGSEIKSKVLEIQEDIIKYTLYDSPNGPLRNIRISDVFMIIYQDGTRENFTVKSETKNAEEKTPIRPPAISEQSPQQEVYKTVPSPVSTTVQPPYQDPPIKPPHGFIFGFDAGLHVPFDSDFSEIYGLLIRGGIVLGYWGKGFGVESHINYGYMKGDPINSGSVDESSSEIGMTRLMFSGYWKTKGTRVFFYAGGGFGICGVKEQLTMSAFGKSDSNVISTTWFDLHASLGMKLGNFCWQISPTSITSSDNDHNLGGAVLSIGVFF
jgi:hypothetical protein